jgi:hypothetical protein
MKSRINHFKWLRGLGNVSYIIGAAFLIASLLTSVVPPAIASANQPSSQLNCEYTNTPNPPTNTPEPPTNTPVTPPNTPTNTPEPPTNTPTNTSTDTPVNTPTHTPETPANTPTPTDTPTDTPTNTPTDTPTDAPTITPTDTPTNTPTNTPTFTPTFFDPFGLEFFCTGIRVINMNDFEAPFAWNIDGGPSGTGMAAPFSFVDIETGYYPGIVTLYSGQQLMASGFLPTDCGEDENTPTPPAVTSSTPRPTNTPRSNPTEVFKTLVPRANSTPEILIPVTGVDLAGGSNTQRMLFNMGLGLLGLGFVLNGLSRNRKDLDI